MSKQQKTTKMKDILAEMAARAAGIAKEGATL
jgi:hypothetical protein